MQQKPSFDEIMDSLTGMRRAAMPAALQQRIVSGLLSPRRRALSLSRPTLLLAAAGLALLIGFNAYSLVSHQQEMGRAERVGAAANALTEEYFAPAPSI